jgi:hypothetical protein
MLQEALRSKVVDPFLDGDLDRALDQRRAPRLAPIGAWHADLMAHGPGLGSLLARVRRPAHRLHLVLRVAD